jgi:hypothetical protein
VDESSSSEDEDGRGNRNRGGAGSSRMNRRTAGRKNDQNNDTDEEMQDAVPDVKAVSSSTDSSRLSNTATKHRS